MFVLEHVVDRGDVAVVQAGDRARFPVQSLVGFGAGRFREGFERDPALQALVVREVDGAHGTGSSARSILYGPSCMPGVSCIEEPAANYSARVRKPRDG